MRLLLIALVAIIILPLRETVSFAAHTACGGLKAVMKYLSKKHEEQPVKAGIAKNGGIVVGIVTLFAKKNNATWTIVITHTNGSTCFLADGADWEQLPEPQWGRRVELLFPHTAIVPASLQLCVERTKMRRTLWKDYREKPVESGVSNRDMLVELFTSKGGKTWTLAEHSPQGRRKSCVLAAGELWRKVKVPRGTYADMYIDQWRRGLSLATKMNPPLALKAGGPR